MYGCLVAKHLHGGYYVDYYKQLIEVSLEKSLCVVYSRIRSNSGDFCSHPHSNGKGGERSLQSIWPQIRPSWNKLIEFLKVK